MILIGQFDSSFVRRVGIALTLLEIEYEHRPWSVFGDAERIRPYNPLLRVPVLIVGNADRQEAVLTETFAILDYVDSLVPEHRRLTPAGGTERREAMRISALASQVADTAVSLFYEKVLHAEPSVSFIARRTSQLLGGLDALERERAARPSSMLFGERVLNADIAFAAVVRHAAESHPNLFAIADYPELSAHCARLEALPVFQTLSQPFIPPS